MLLPLTIYTTHSDTAAAVHLGRVCRDKHELIHSSVLTKSLFFLLFDVHKFVVMSCLKFKYVN